MLDRQYYKTVLEKLSVIAMILPDDFLGKGGFYGGTDKAVLKRFKVNDKDRCIDFTLTFYQSKGLQRPKFIFRRDFTMKVNDSDIVTLYVIGIGQNRGLCRIGSIQAPHDFTIIKRFTRTFPLYVELATNTYIPSRLFAENFLSLIVLYLAKPYLVEGFNITEYNDLNPYDAEVQREYYSKVSQPAPKARNIL